MDLSNKSLALLLLAAIVISLGGTMLSLDKLSQVQQRGVGDFDPITARAASAGWASVNITDVVGCTIDYNVELGTGAAQSLEIGTQHDNSGGGFNDCSGASTTCGGMQLNNTGNVDVNVTFNSSDAGASFLGGPSAVNADFVYTTLNGSIGGTGVRPGCNNITGITNFGGTYGNVPTATTFICNNLSASNSNDMIIIEYNVTIRPDTPGGLKNATIRVECLEI